MDRDPVTARRNRPIKKTWLYVSLAVVGCFGAMFMMPKMRGAGGGADPEPGYTRADPKFKNVDAYWVAQQEAANPQIKVSREQLEFQMSRDGMRAPEESPSPREEEKPSPSQERIKQMSENIGRIERERTQPARSNPYRQQWMSRQQQAFTSSPRTGGWNLRASEGGTKVGKPSATDYVKALLESQKAASDTRSAQEKFFESGGRMTDPVLKNTRQAKSAPYVLPAGTIIPCVLISGINTDLPGNVTAQVSENVCDWVDPSAVLIPRGSRVFGTYSSSVAFGQKRAQVAWTLLTFPDGSTLNLGGMSGTDKAGYAGIRDQYNSHVNSMFMATVVTASLAAMSDMIGEEDSGIYIGTESTSVQEEVAESVLGMGESLFKKYLDRKPTVTVRPGKTFNIQVSRDVPFQASWN